MTSNLIGAVVYPDFIDVVTMQQTGPKSFNLLDEVPFRLPAGGWGIANWELFDQLEEYFKQNNIAHVCLMPSIISRDLTVANLDVMGLTKILEQCAEKANIAFHFFYPGFLERLENDTTCSHAGKYQDDDNFWEQAGLANLSKGRRKAAFLVLAKFSS
jgi:hypothetical protein